MTLPSLEGFTTAVKEFCSLAESEEPLTESDLWKIRELLLRLIFHIPAVDAAPSGIEHEGTRPDQRQYEKIARRFTDFPFNVYKVVFDPHDLTSTDEPVMSTLSDDLSDIYRDLAHGLDNLNNGHLPDACADWSCSYRFHWARHTVNALAAIEIYRTDNHITIEPALPANPPKSDG